MGFYRLPTTDYRLPTTDYRGEVGLYFGTYGEEFIKNIKFKLNLDKDLRNHWLAGFSDADASFQIKTLNRNNKVEIRLNFQIDQKKDKILLLIKDLFGGNIGYRKSQDTYYYGSTSFGSAKKVINYFDYFHLLSSKHINYLKWRKAYLIIQDRDHLNKNGIEKIIKLKNTMNQKSYTTNITNTTDTTV
uniref:LAGLIDADG homing endonuclease n=1 Tax=Blastosporella zonata TaxID=530045 RepID=A0A386TY16_9AGAR|nr:LAGLIDADG homing endonuclease [Blastosporella zonata]AYE93114.1 LAGLIDADG homing endonuclease [Blastosporella zonata]